MDASIRPTWHTSPTCWLKRMLLCAPLWSAATFRSTAACSLAMASSRDSRPMLIPAARAALRRPGTATSATAAAPALTRAAVPLLRLNKPGADPLNGPGVPGRGLPDIVSKQFHSTLAWTFAGSHGTAQYIHVVERLHGIPQGDITITASTFVLLFSWRQSFILLYQCAGHLRREKNGKNPKKRKKERGVMYRQRRVQERRR